VQVDENRFNRASLINVGYLHAKNDPRFDYLAMHDVDLLPLNPELKYRYPGNGNALHIADPRLHPLYHYPDFVGGILLVTMTDFDRLNGLSNKYWGWGKEDDDFSRRMKRGRITVLRPVDVTTGTENSFK
jgi:xylosylprotein 4-beta-galactosyltransferase